MVTDIRRKELELIEERIERHSQRVQQTLAALNKSNLESLVEFVHDEEILFGQIDILA